MSATADLMRTSVGIDDAVDTDYAVQEHFRRANVTDGLPVIVPTVERVDAFISRSGFAPDREVGPVPPAFGVATVANVAVNAVMAGARPEHLGIILASLEAMLDPKFNLAGIQVTTNPVAPLTVVNGPIRHRLEIDSGAHAYSGGNNPNGSIGRALRFALRNIGDAKGEVDRSTLGMPSKFSFVMAENEEANPWHPLHVTFGHQASDDVVTVFGPESIIDTCRPTFSTCEPLIEDFAELMRSVGTNRLSSCGTLLWAIPPFQARLLAKEGWTMEGLQQELFQRARFEVAPQREYEGNYSRRRRKGADGLNDITRSAADINIIVAGRDDPLHATYLPSVMISWAISNTVWTP
jgi:hypothetical protein